MKKIVKLETLKEFEANKLHKKEMENVTGGDGKGGESAATQGGCLPRTNFCYISDYVNANGEMVYMV